MDDSISLKTWSSTQPRAPILDFQRIPMTSKTLVGSGRSKRRDEKEMAKFGKRQELRRDFGFMSALGLSTTLMITWVGIFIVFAGGLTDGGPAGLIYGFLFCWVGYFATVASLVEMLSMAPIAGGEYHWIYLLAPKSNRKFLSFITGWASVLSWQAALASGTSLSSSMIQGILILACPNYDVRRWHGTLLIYAVLLLAFISNTYLARYLPIAEGLILIIYVIGFFGILITLTYLAPHVDARSVFTNYLALGGYDNVTTFCVGLVTSGFAFIGADGVIHLCEEIKDASTVVPHALLTAVGLNGCMGFAMLIAVLFSVGDIYSALASPTGFPFFEIFTHATNSISGTTIMVVVVLLMTIFCTVAVLAVTSRMTWAFARDNGLPGSQYLAKIDPKTKLPWYAIVFSVVTSTLLAVVNVASPTAFHAFVSLTISGYLGSYFLPIILMLIRRLTNSSAIQYGPFKLGKFGVICNVFSLFWICVVFVFSFFPIVKDGLTLDTMNWSSVLWAACMGSGVVVYFGYQQGRYIGPVVETDLVGHGTSVSYDS